jgi:UDP:flavonoid glycosyltransferase YjiC (YdhE family)
VLWSPAVVEPDWWARLGDEQPVVYVTLGSSGHGRLLDAALRGLADLPVTVIAAAAGNRGPERAPANAFVADYLSGEAACRRAALVVSNGGSLTVQQALVAGRPLLGLAANLDQHLSMTPVEAAGAGLLVRSEEATPSAIRQAARRLLDEPSFRASAESLAPRIGAHDAPAAFARAVEEMAAR